MLVFCVGELAYLRHAFRNNKRWQPALWHSYRVALVDTFKHPDEATVEWFIKSEVTIMEGEIEDLSDM